MKEGFVWVTEKKKTEFGKKLDQLRLFEVIL